jgi:hypothetical protein
MTFTINFDGEGLDCMRLQVSRDQMAADNRGNGEASLQESISHEARVSFASLCALAEAHFVNQESVAVILHALQQTASGESSGAKWAAEALEAMRRCGASCQ